jgi:hypothetical protein
VLDDIAEREATLLDNIKTYAEEAIGVHQEVEDFLFGVAQRKMSDQEKYDSNRLKAEELYREAAAKTAEAERASGEEKIRLLEESKTLMKEGFDYAKKLQGAIVNTSEIEEQITASKLTERDLRNEIHTLSASDEGYATTRKKLEEEIAEEKRKQKEYQEEISASNKASREIEGLALEYQNNMSTAIKSQSAASKDMVTSLKEQAVTIEALQEKANALAALLREEIKFNADFREASIQLEGFKTSLNALIESPAKLDFSVDMGETPEKLKTTSADILKIGDTWTKVWTRNKEVAEDSILSLKESLDQMDDVDVDIKFTGSGSETLPISEKIKGIKQLLIDLVAESYVIDFFIKGIDEAIKKVTSLKESIDDLKGKTIYITQVIRTRKEGEEGGEETVKAQVGRRIGGYGGGDVVPALLEPGEWVIRKEAVKKYGDNFFSRLNAGLLGRIPGFKVGGKVGASSDIYEKMKDLVYKLNNYGGYLGAKTAGSYDPKQFSPPDVTTIKNLMEQYKSSWEYQNKPSSGENYLENISETLSQLTKLGGVSTYKRERDYQETKSGLNKSQFDYADLLSDTFKGIDYIGDIQNLATQYKAFVEPKGAGWTEYGASIKDAFSTPLEQIKNALAKRTSSVDSTTKTTIGASIQKFATGGLVHDIGSMLKLPTSPSLQMAPQMSTGGSAEKIVNHKIDFNFGGKSVGPFMAEGNVVEQLLHKLSQAKKRS